MGSVSFRNNWNPEVKTVGDATDEIRIFSDQVMFEELFGPSCSLVGCESFNFSLCEDRVERRDRLCRSQSIGDFRGGKLTDSPERAATRSRWQDLRG